mmetsp:Transcript_44534/g.140498  ORF Transcript_44534/g.140498 Transcript_44534/m.140498 type:complete len:580 (-) Transcript_44534:331-2070(-)
MPCSSSEPARKHGQLSEQADEIVRQLQPHRRAERHRLTVFEYVKKLIKHVADEENKTEIYVHRFGSVPLKTYLPHGDLDVTAFAANDLWLERLKAKLEDEAKKNDMYVVSGVHSVPRDLRAQSREELGKKDQGPVEIVKVVKCQVNGISVDITANALGGMCNLCFLEKVDTMLKRDHLFKRATILVKSWCYFESHILSSQNGLLSTYALETLVLCIVNIFHEELQTPLDVLKRFLEYYANFDWRNHCLTMRGPVNRSNIPPGGEVPHLDNEPSYLLNDAILQEDSHLQFLMSGLQDDNRGFQWKYMNICDPLSTRNNIGRSVSRSSAYRIASAFRHGWQSLSGLLYCSLHHNSSISLTKSEKSARAFFHFTGKTLTGHRPDVGDFSFPNASRNASSTVSSRSTDQGQSAASVSENSHEGTSDCEAEHEGSSYPPAEIGIQTAEALSQLNKDFNGIVTSSPILHFRQPHKEQGVNSELAEPPEATGHEGDEGGIGHEEQTVVNMEMLPAQRRDVGHGLAEKQLAGQGQGQKISSEPLDSLDEPLRHGRCKENDGSSENSGFSDSDNEHMLHAQSQRCDIL